MLGFHDQAEEHPGTVDLDRAEEIGHEGPKVASRAPRVNEAQTPGTHDSHELFGEHGPEEPFDFGWRLEGPLEQGVVTIAGEHGLPLASGVPSGDCMELRGI